METLARIFHQATMFPFSTGIHVLLMSVAGWMVVHSHIRGGVMLRTLGILLALQWCLYEGLEFAQIKDNVSADLAVGIIGFVAGTLIAYSYHWHIRKWIAKLRGPY